MTIRVLPEAAFVACPSLRERRAVRPCVIYVCLLSRQYTISRVPNAPLHHCYYGFSHTEDQAGIWHPIFHAFPRWAIYSRGSNQLRMATTIAHQSNYEV